MNRARLAAEHREISAMARQLMAIVEADVPPDPLAFLRFRRDFGRMLTRHLKHEEWAVYPVLVNHRDPAVRAGADALCSESLAFGVAFASYARDWTAARIAAEWEAFGVATAMIVAKLLDRIEIEENRLYPLLTPNSETAQTVPLRRAG